MTLLHDRAGNIQDSGEQLLLGWMDGLLSYLLFQLRFWRRLDLTSFSECSSFRPYLVVVHHVSDVFCHLYLHLSPLPPPDIYPHPWCLANWRLSIYQSRSGCPTWISLTFSLHHLWRNLYRSCNFSSSTSGVLHCGRSLHLLILCSHDCYLGIFSTLVLSVSVCSTWGVGS